MKVLPLFAAGVALANAQSLPDPADLLEQARDKVIGRVPPIGYACVATIDRSFFALETPPAIPNSCEQVSADRKKNRTKLQLDKTDRLRLQATLTSEGEIYSWTGPEGFSRNVEEVVHSGDIGTGALAAHIEAVFANPLVRFRLLSQTSQNLEFGFRVPVEASHYLVKAGAGWRLTGYEGSLQIDPTSLELRQLTIDTEELPAESSMCESNTKMDYKPEDQRTGGDGMLLPSTVHSRDLNRDATETAETDWVTRFSDCREASEKAPDRLRSAPLFPPTFAALLKLELTAPIDTSTAAAGDVVTARLSNSVRGPANSLAPAGAILTGRIMRLEHQKRKPSSFLIWLDFDTIEANGVVSSIRARLIGCGDPDPQICSIAKMSDQKWNRALHFHADSPKIVVPRGFPSRWVTGDPPLK